MAGAEQDESIPGFEQAFSEAVGDRGPTAPYATTQRLAGGLGGEKAAVEDLARQGHQVLWYKPDILGTNQGGIDAVTMKDGVVYLLDNKSYNTERNVSGVSALTTNFERNLDDVKLNLNNVLNQKDLNPAQDQVIHAALDALDRGDYVKAVTNANIFSRSGEVPQDVTDRLEQEHGIQFINLMPKSPPAAEPATDRLHAAEPAADRPAVEEPPAGHPSAQEPSSDRTSTEEPPASYQPSEEASYNESSSVSAETTDHEPARSEESTSSYQPSPTSEETSYRDTGYSYDPVSGSFQPSSTSEEESTTREESSLSSEEDSANSYAEDHSGSGESDTKESDYEEPSYEDTSYEDTSHEPDPVEEDHSSFDEEDR
jgi:hypothetical protein